MEYEDLFQQSSISGHWLRSSTGTTSCKLSALLYILIHFMKDKISPYKIPSFTRQILKDIQGDHPRVRHLKHILSNRSINGTIIKDTTFLKGDMWYVGLVKKSQDMTLPGNVIDHYFVIVRTEDGFKIVSSYGCPFVYIKQYETFLNIDEFDGFIKALDKVRTRTSEEVIRNFIRKYFLNLDHYIEKKVDPDENDGRTTTSPTLREREVECYLRSKYHMEFYPIMDTLQTMIGMRQKNTRKGKRKQYVHFTRDRDNSFYKK